MKKLLIAIVALLAVLVLLAASGPILARLGVPPLFCIEAGRGGLKLVHCPEEQIPLPAATPIPQAAGIQPMLIDTDMAPDDWMAILFLLMRPDVDVRAITVVGTGEAHCDPGVQNALNLAALAGRPEMPVACGRQTPLQGDHVFPDAWRERSDNLMGLTLPANTSPPSEQAAVGLITTTLRASSEAVAVITLGPLTNLAEALQADPSLVDKIESIVIMGGAFNVDGNIAVSGVGIDNDAAEWNLYIDPHAVTLILHSGAPITFVPLDATNQVPVTEGFYDRLAEDRSAPTAEFVYQVLTSQLDFVSSGGYFFWDPLASAIGADESLGTYAEERVRIVEGEGPESGATRIDATGVPCRITVAADRERFESLFLAALNGRQP